MRRYSSRASSSRLALVGEGLARALEVVLQLLPDGGELVVDQRRRQLELVRLLQLVEQLALQLQARGVGVLAGDLRADQLLQLRDAFGAQRLGERVVDLRTHGRGHFLHLDGEGRILAGQRGDRIVGREGGDDIALIAGLGAGDAFLEARDEVALAEHDRRRLGGAAFERFAVDLADEVDRDAIALLGGAGFVGREGDAALDELAHRLVDGFGIDVGDQALELQALEVGQVERGQHLERHRIGKVGLAGEHALDLGLVFRQADARLHRRTLLAIGQRLVAGVAHGLLQHLDHERAAVHLLQMRHRHLALAEALELHPVLHLVQAIGEAFVELSGRDDHLQRPLQTFVARFGNLHCSPTCS